MASPIILKPLAISSTESIPIVLVLNAPHPWYGGIQLKLGDTVLEPANAYDKKKSSLVQPLQNNKSLTARDAFINLAKNKLHGEVIEL